MTIRRPPAIPRHIPRGPPGIRIYNPSASRQCAPRPPSHPAVVKPAHQLAGMTGLTSFYRLSIHRALFAIRVESLRLGHPDRRRSRSETHLSAKQAHSQASARLSRPPGNRGWPQGVEESARQRAQAAVGVIQAPVGDSPTVVKGRGPRLGRLTKRAEFLRGRGGPQALGCAVASFSRRGAPIPTAMICGSALPSAGKSAAPWSAIVSAAACAPWRGACYLVAPGADLITC